MHTDSSLEELEDVTKALGNCFCHFAEVICPRYDTFETDKEAEARQRCQAAAGNKSTKAAATSGGRKAKTFSLATFKLHSLPDYPSVIRRVGPTDGYSTQVASILSTMNCCSSAESST